MTKFVNAAAMAAAGVLVAVIGAAFVIVLLADFNVIGV